MNWTVQDPRKNGRSRGQEELGIRVEVNKGKAASVF